MKDNHNTLAGLALAETLHRTEARNIGASFWSRFVAFIIATLQSLPETADNNARSERIRSVGDKVREAVAGKEAADSIAKDYGRIDGKGAERRLAGRYGKGWKPAQSVRQAQARVASYTSTLAAAAAAGVAILPDSSAKALRDATAAAKLAALPEDERKAAVLENERQEAVAKAGAAIAAAAGEAPEILPLVYRFNALIYAATDAANVTENNRIDHDLVARIAAALESVTLPGETPDEGPEAPDVPEAPARQARRRAAAAAK